jgi:5-methylcytosine-specific restriction endonuclease McrA
MDQYQILLIVLASIGLFASIVHFTLFESVKKRSTMYKKLKTINKKYVLDKPLLKQKDMIVKCKSKKQYDSMILDDYLQSEIEDDITFFDNLIAANEHAYQNYRAYVKEYSELLPKSPRNNGPYRLKETRQWVYFWYEKLIYIYYKLKPYRYTKIYLYSSYVSSQGKRSYNKHHIYSYDAVKKHYDHVKKALVQKTTRQNLIRIERAKVTVSMRDAVFRRDHYTCQICGATRSDGIMLVVDHIRPVSKGGKTELDNLQTLCDRCNLGKSDKDT